MTFAGTDIASGAVPAHRRWSPCRSLQPTFTTPHLALKIPGALAFFLVLLNASYTGHALPSPSQPSLPKSFPRIPKNSRPTSLPRHSLVQLCPVHQIACWCARTGLLVSVIPVLAVFGYNLHLHTSQLPLKCTSHWFSCCNRK